MFSSPSTFGGTVSQARGSIGSTFSSRSLKHLWKDGWITELQPVQTRMGSLSTSIWASSIISAHFSSILTGLLHIKVFLYHSSFLISVKVQRKAYLSHCHHFRDHRRSLLVLQHQTLSLAIINSSNLPYFLAASEHYLDCTSNSGKAADSSPQPKWCWVLLSGIFLRT